LLRIEEGGLLVEIGIIATSVVTVLAPYLTVGIAAFSNKVGEVAADKVCQLYQAVKNKFSEDSYAGQTLVRAEEKPKSEDRLAALKGVLIEKMEQDPGFAASLQKLLADLPPTVNISVSGDRNVVAGGNINDSFIITGDRK